MSKRQLKLVALFACTAACAVASLFPSVATVNVVAIPLLVFVTWKLKVL
jgi:hypothetical protein